MTISRFTVSAVEPSSCFVRHSSGCRVRSAYRPRSFILHGITGPHVSPSLSHKISLKLIRTFNHRAYPGSLACPRLKEQKKEYQYWGYSEMIWTTLPPR